MSTTQHTPTPWKLTEPDRIEQEGFGMICTTRGDNWQAPANAAFIVRACNSHDALVKALERTVLLLENSSGLKCRKSRALLEEVRGKE